jgi:hypothetical protein
MGCKKKRTRKIAAALGALLLASTAWAELSNQTVSASSTATNLTIEAATLTIVNDGANEIYVRVFVKGETVASATTSDAEIKSGEGFTFERSLGIEGVSIVCASAETATVRLFYW